MQTVVIVIHLMLVLAMIGVVLLQKSEGGGLGQLVERRIHDQPRHRQRADPHHGDSRGRFFATSLALSWLAGLGRHPASIINTGGPAAATQQVRRAELDRRRR